MLDDGLAGERASCCQAGRRLRPVLDERDDDGRVLSGRRGRRTARRAARRRRLVAALTPPTWRPRCTPRASRPAPPRPSPWPGVRGQRRRAARRCAAGRRRWSGGTCESESGSPSSHHVNDTDSPSTSSPTRTCRVTPPSTTMPAPSTSCASSTSQSCQPSAVAISAQRLVTIDVDFHRPLHRQLVHGCEIIATAEVARRTSCGPGSGLPPGGRGSRRPSDRDRAHSACAAASSTVVAAPPAPTRAGRRAHRRRNQAPSADRRREARPMIMAMMLRGRATAVRPDAMGMAPAR